MGSSSSAAIVWGVPVDERDYEAVPGWYATAWEAGGLHLDDLEEPAGDVGYGTAWRHFVSQLCEALKIQDCRVSHPDEPALVVGIGVATDGGTGLADFRPSQLRTTKHQRKRLARALRALNVGREEPLPRPRWLLVSCFD